MRPLSATLDVYGMPLATKRKVAPPAAISFHDPALYANRELSLLEFQRRVLEEAQDPTNPLLERAKFLSILGSNLDEFFMVRVAGLLNQIESGTQETGADGMPPTRQLDAIRTVIQQCSPTPMPACAAWSPSWRRGPFHHRFRDADPRAKRTSPTATLSKPCSPF